MILRFSGQQSHAAYPETGCNPASVLSALVSELDVLTQNIEQTGDGMVLSTVVGMLVGGRNFGVSPGEGELCLTIRAHYESDLMRLADSISARARALCDNRGIRLDISYLDIFPDTTNNRTFVQSLRALLKDTDIPHMTLSDPMRW